MRTKGWKNVFSFTFVQQVKSKSFIVGTIIITLLVALLAAAADILPVFMLENKLGEAANGSAPGEPLTISKVYICNKTGYSFDMSAALNEIGVGSETIGADAVQQKLDSLVNSAAQEAVSVIAFDEKAGFSINSEYAGASEAIKSGDCSTINTVLAAEVKAQYLKSYGVPEEQLPYAMSDVRTASGKAGEAPRSVIKDVVSSVVPMLSAIILFMFIFIYSQYVAQAIAIEKSSRIMEYLLTSIKPLALIIGKVLAMCCVSLMQFIIIILGGVAGFMATMPFGIVTKLGNITAMVDNAANAAAASGVASDAQTIMNDIVDAFSGFDISALLIMIIVFILGFLFFALIAGLAGASISKMEDLASALQPLSIIGVIGFYLAYFPQVTGVDGEENMMMVVARFLPISSPFILPSDYMLGKIDIVTTLISVVILVVTDILMAMLVAKVYEHIVLHTGKKLSIKDMLNMANNK